MASSKQFTVFTKFAVKNQMSGPMIGIAKQADKLAERSEKAKQSLAGIGKIAAGAGKFVLGMGAAAAGAGAAVFALAKVSSDAADDMLNTAGAIGMTTDALQEFRYVGVKAGMTTEEMDNALTKMTVNLGKNFEEVDAALYQVGLSAEGLKAAGPDKALEYIAQGFKDVKDPAKKAAVATALFGKSSVRMVNALSGGAENIADIKKEAHAIGYVMGEEMVKQAGAMDDSLDKLGATAKGLAYRLGAGLVPQITAMVDKFQKGIAPGGQFEGIIKLASSLGNMFGSLASGFFDKFGEFASKMAPYIESIVRSIEPLIKPLLGLLDPLFKIAERVAPIIEGAVKVVAAVLGPVIEGITALLDAIAGVGTATPGSGLHGGVSSDPNFGKVGGGAPRWTPAPMGGVSSVSSSTTSTSNVKIDVAAPAGTKVTQDKPAPGVTLNTGGAHPAGVSRWGPKP